MEATPTFKGSPPKVAEGLQQVGDLAALPGYRGDFEAIMPAAMPKAEVEVKTRQIEATSCR